MIKCFIMYDAPSDPEAFMRRYGEHVELVKKIPELVSFSFNTPTAASPSPKYFLVAEMCFANEASLQRAMASPENKACARDAKQFASGSMTFLTVEEKVIKLEL